ncbi:hypothetical protein ABZ896_17310 [Streptomyces sp. NPDC047072]|uniref:hypothetical protein n=1 Tax=Streptomyces sp. NPDC047072 TaxID=3154809 RepID=UPI0033D32023
MNPTRHDDPAASGKGPSTRHGRACDGLRSLLLSGSFAPGARLTEADLTQRFGVSPSERTVAA